MATRGAATFPCSKNARMVPFIAVSRTNATSARSSITQSVALGLAIRQIASFETQPYVYFQF